MNSVSHEAWQRAEDARLIIERDGGWRSGLPNAWCQALMHLNRHVHIPVHARADWEWLTNEMGRSIESCRHCRGMQFMEGISELEIRDMYHAFKRIYGCVANLAARIEAKESDAREIEAAQQTGELCAVSYDFSFRVH